MEHTLLLKVYSVAGKPKFISLYCPGEIKTPQQVKRNELIQYSSEFCKETRGPLAIRAIRAGITIAEKMAVEKLQFH